MRDPTYQILNSVKAQGEAVANQLETPMGKLAIATLLTQASTDIEIDMAGGGANVNTILGTLQTGMNTAIESYHAESAFNKNSAAIADPTVATLATYDAAIANGVTDPIIQKKVVQLGRERRADKYVDNWLNTNVDLETQITNLSAIAGNIDENLVQLTRERANSAITKRIEKYKADLTAGTMTDDQLRTIIDAPGTNPNLKTALEKFWKEDEGRVADNRKRSEKAAHYGADATAFAGGLATVGRGSDNHLDVGSLSRQIASSSGAAAMTGPLKIVMDNLIANRELRFKDEQEIAKAKINEEEINLDAAQIEKNVATLSTWSKRLVRVAGGAALLGYGIPAVMGIGGVTPFLNSITNVIGGGNLITWLGANPNITGKLLIGGGIGALIKEKFLKGTTADRAKVAKAAGALQEQNKKVHAAENELNKLDVNVLKSYTTIAGTINAIVNKTNLDETIKHYLETANITKIEAIAAATA